VNRCLPLRVVPSNRRPRVVATTARLPSSGTPSCDAPLDVEGFEVWTLRGLDLDRDAPPPLLVDMREIGEMRAGVEEVLGDRYEPVEVLSPFDVLYRRVGDD
jgi:hypothetical protein